MSDSAKKAELFRAWLVDHALEHAFALFDSKFPYFTPTDHAISVLSSLNANTEYLYIMYMGEGYADLRPLYIGKTSSPSSRWLQGHLRGLRKAAAGFTKSHYQGWIEVLREVPTEVYLACIAQENIIRSPIPGFPTTVGSIEYQLIALAADAFPRYLLNYEGVAR
jgi:hypothetical protein